MTAGNGDSVKQQLEKAIANCDWELRFHGELGPDGIDAIIKALPRLSAARALSLSNARIGDEGLGQLLRAGRQLGAFKRLDLSGCDIGVRGLRALVKHARDLHRVQSLSLSQNAFGEAGAAVLAEAISAGMTSLTDLSLTECGIGDEGMRAIADVAHHVTQLEGLSLDGNALGDDGVKCIAEVAKHWTGLKYLGLSSNRLGASAVGSLSAAANHFGNLRFVSLDRNPIGDDGARLLFARQPSWTSTLELDLSATGLGWRGIEALGNSIPEFGCFTRLTLSHNDLGPKGGELLGEMLYRLPVLERLTLQSASIGDIGLSALLSGLPARNRLSWLELAQNGISPTGMESLALAVDRLSALRTFDLSDNAIARGIQPLARALGKLPKMHTLELSRCGLGDEEAKLLAHAILPMRGIVFLRLVGNNIGDEGAAALAGASESREFFSFIELEGNPITVLPKEVLNPGMTDSLLEFFQNRGQEPKTGLSDAKLLLLGEGRVGKTHLRKRLWSRDRFYHHSGEIQTHDFEVAPWIVDYWVGDKPRSVRLSGWDFGGQPHLHATHRLFLSDRRCVFVIVCDATKTRRENRLDYWLRLVAHEGSAASPVVVVVTKCDLRTDDGDAVAKRRLESLDASELRRSAGFDAKTTLRVVEGVGWSAFNGDEPNGHAKATHDAAMSRLEAAIIDSLPEVPDFNTSYPYALLTVLEWIRNAAFVGADGDGLPYIRLDTVLDVCRKNGLADSLTDVAVAIGHNLGLLHTVSARKLLRPGDPLRDFVFNPMWVRGPAYRVIREGLGAGPPGVLSWAQLETLLPLHGPSPKANTLWERREFTAADRLMLIELLLSCELMFDVHRGYRTAHYLVPDHLTPRLTGALPDGDYVWKRIFEWIPESAFGRILGRLHQQVARGDAASLWRDEITVAVGRARVTVRYCPEGLPNTVDTSVGAALFVAVTGCTQNEAIRLLDLVDAEVRAVLGEPAIGPIRWQPVVGAGEGKRSSPSGTPDFARYAAIVYGLVKAAADKGACQVESWANLVEWAERIVEAAGRNGLEPEVVAAVREAKADVIRFADYCRKAKMRAWWSGRGKRKVSRSATDWSGARDDDD